MSSASEKIMDMVEADLKKNRDVSNEVLYEKATKIDPAIKELTLRQFHARFPLQVKRKMSRGKSKGRKKKTEKTSASPKSSRSTPTQDAKKTGEDDERAAAVRDVLIRFARDVSAAESKAETIGVLTRVDGYVEKALKALENSGR